MPVTTSGVTVLGAVGAKETKKATGYDSILGTDAFLKLMVAKLSNQDPLNPTDDSEFLGQLAQMTTLEQTVYMKQNTSSLQALSLVGKTVIAEYNDNYIMGEVSSVISDGGSITLNIEGCLVPLENLKEVMADGYTGDNTSEAEGGTDGTADNQ